MPLFRKGDVPVFGYRLEKFLGRGQFGDVWLATAPGNVRAALKFIDLSGKQGLKEFKGVQRVREIRHPHLLSITAIWLLDQEGNSLSDEVIDRLEAEALGKKVDLKQTMDISFGHPSLMVVAMPLGDKSLLDILEEKGPAGFSTEELLDYMEESAKGIDYLNSPKHDLGDGVTVGIQHCDIKPANIMLMGESALVCDFGLARVLSFGGDVHATSTGMAGTPAYMAPECIEGKLPSDSTDQYSLAITYYELRTGRLPFEEESQASQMAILTAHVKGKLDYSRLALEEQEIIRRATSLDPAARWPSCLTMVRELQKVTGGRGVVQRPSEKDSGWSASGFGGAPSSGSSVFETRHEPEKESGQQDSKRISQRGSNHETIVPQEAAKLSDSAARDKESKAEQFETTVSEHTAPADEAPPTRPLISQTLIPEHFDEPVQVEEPPAEQVQPASGNKDTLVEGGDTHRDSVRYDKPHATRADAAALQQKSSIPWGAITTTVAIVAVAVVLLMNFGKDIPLPESLASLLYGNSTDVKPVETDSEVPPGTKEKNDDSKESFNPVVPPEDLEPWEVALQAHFEADEYLEACLMLHDTAAEKQLEVPPTQRAIAAREILKAWRIAETQGKTLDGTLDLAAAAAKAVPSDQVLLKSMALDQFLQRVSEALRAMEVRYRDEEAVPQEELKTVEAQLQQIIEDLRLFDGQRPQPLLADAYLLNARSALRHDPIENLTAPQLQVARKHLGDMDTTQKSSAARLSAEQTRIETILKMRTASKPQHAVDVMNQLSPLLSDRTIAQRIPPWELELANYMKEKIRPDIFSMAENGELTSDQRATALGLWPELPNEDYYSSLVAHLENKEQPGTPDDLREYYQRLKDLATNVLQSRSAKLTRKELALAQFCQKEGLLGLGAVNVIWSDLESDLSSAKNDIDEAHQNYAQYVSGRLTYLNPQSRRKESAAEDIFSAYEGPSPLLQTAFRKAAAAEILADAPAYILPTDRIFFDEIVNVSDEQLEESWKCLQKSQELQVDSGKPAFTLPGNLHQVIVQAHRADAEPTELLAAANSARSFDQASGGGELLKKRKQEDLYEWSKAKLYDKLSKSSNAAAQSHAHQAIASYSALADRLWKDRIEWTGIGARIQCSAIYHLAIKPALNLKSIADLEDAKPAEKADLARCYFLKGELIRIDPQFFWAEASFHPAQPVPANEPRAVDRRHRNVVARAAYHEAGELDSQLEYLTREGLQILEAVPVSQRLEELKPVVEQALGMAGIEHADPQLFRLQAKLKILEYRPVIDRVTLREGVEEAAELVNQALAKTNPNDREYAALLTDQAGLLVSESFTYDDDPTKRQKLTEVIELCRQVTERYKDRYHPAEAFCAMGNAQEDLALHLGDTAEYDNALSSFEKAIASDPGNSWGSQGNSYMNKGRCYIRYARALYHEDREQNESRVIDYYSKAHEALESAIELNAQDDFLVAESYLWAGEANDELSLVDPSQDVSPDQVEANFRKATTIAEMNRYDVWPEYQIRLVKFLDNMALARFRANKPAEFETYAKKALDERMDLLVKGNLIVELKPEKVTEVTKGLVEHAVQYSVVADAVPSLVHLDTAFRNSIYDAIETGLRFLHDPAQPPNIHEMEIHLARSEYILTEAIEYKHELSQREKDYLTEDKDFLVAHAANQTENNIDKRIQLLTPVVAAIAMPDPNAKIDLTKMKALVSDVEEAIDAHIDDTSTTRNARQYHEMLVSELFSKEYALSAQERMQLARKVEKYLEVYTFPGPANNPQQEFKGVIERIKMKAGR